jgi:hypothetical protein
MCGGLFFFQAGVVWGGGGGEAIIPPPRGKSSTGTGDEGIDVTLLCCTDSLAEFTLIAKMTRDEMGSVRTLSTVERKPWRSVVVLFLSPLLPFASDFVKIPIHAGNGQPI